MNTKGRTQGQLILVAGFLVAIAIIGVAMTLSGVFFTQNVEESGLSQFESSATSQQASADFAAKRGLSLTNLLAERRGLNGSNLTKSLINYMKNYTRTTQNVSQLQAVVNVSVDNSSLNQSWVSGMKKAGVLPGWTYNITEKKNKTINVTTGRSPFDIVYTLDTSGSMGSPAVENATIWKPNGSWIENPDGYLDPDDGDTVCSPPSPWDVCQVKLVQGDDPDGESQYDVGMGDYVKNPSNDQFGEVIGQRNCGGSGCEWELDYISGGTEWVNDSGYIYSSSEDVEIGDVVRNNDNGLVGVVTNQYGGYDYWRVDYNSSGSEWVWGSDLDVRVSAALEDWDVQYRYLEYSSSRNKLDVAKEATRKAVGAMNESDRGALAEYNDDSNLIRTLTNMTSTGKSNMNSSINSLSDGGQTDIPEGLQTAINHLTSEGDNSENDSDYLVLLSDGKNTDGADADCNYPDDPCSATLAQADQAAAKNIKIFTISFGGEADRELMQEIADRTNGTHMIADSGDLVDILQEIIGDIKDEQPPKTETRTIHEPTLSEPIEKIYNLRLQVQNFTNQESISVNITNTTKDPVTGNNTTRSVWKYTINNTGPSGYKVTIHSDFDSSINRVKSIPDDINDSNNNVTLTMDFDDSIFKVERNQSSEIFDLNPDANVVKDNSPVSFALENSNKSAKGTFRFEFLPVGGSLDSGSISGLCPDNGTTTCGTNDDPVNGTYSTARTRHATVSVSYNSAQGDYENEIEVDAD